MSDEPRVAYELAYREGIRSRDSWSDQLEQYRNRVAGFFIADLIAAGTALGGIGRMQDGASGSGSVLAQAPHLAWLIAMIAGVACTFAAAVWILWRAQGWFRLSPRQLVTRYGDAQEQFPDDDSVYKALALWLELDVSDLARTVDRRCWSIYLSIFGVLVTVVGITGMYVSLIY